MDLRDGLTTTANQTGEYGLQPLIGPPSTTGAAGTVGLTGATSWNSTWIALGCEWLDDKGGNFWFFGGWGLDSTATNGNGALNDLWVYTPNSTVGQPGTWTWVKGSNTGSQNGIYGDEHVAIKPMNSGHPAAVAMRRTGLTV